MISPFLGCLAYIGIVFQLVGHVSGDINGTSSFSDVPPLTLVVGTDPVLPTNPFQAFTLNSLTPFVTLDYGHEVTGHPFFQISSVTGKVQIEVKYSEQFEGLSAPYSDGPFPFSIGLSNTYRVETFEVTGPGLINVFLLQGGLRWQSIRLLTNCTVTFSAVGLNAYVSTFDVNALPGSFGCNDELLNDIWSLGARTVATSCAEKGTQSAMWEVGGNGSLVRGMRPGVSAARVAAEAEDYTLSFDVNIQRAGMGWTVAMPLQYPNAGIQLGIVGDLPETTFVNTNTTLTPKNSITLGYGYSLVNATTLPSYHLGTFPLPVPVKEQTWHTITTILAGGQYLAVLVDSNPVFNISLAKYYIGGSSIPTTGSFGFGGWQDQISFIRNVTLHNTATGRLIYTNPMTSSAVLSEFGVASNTASVCLDGSKRDRLVWLGDFYHTSQIILASTSRVDFLKGTLDNFLDWQAASGTIPINSPLGYPSTEYKDVFSLAGSGSISTSPGQVFDFALPDYQILGLLSFTNYVFGSGDMTWTRRTWPQWRKQVEWLISQVNGTTGLLHLQGQLFLGGGNGGSAINCAFLFALQRMAIISTAANDTKSASEYQTLAGKLGKTINARLWNEQLGVYSISLDQPNDYDLVGNSFAIISGLANATQTARILNKMQDLNLGPGYKDTSLVNSSDPTINISPFTNSFFLHALLLSSNTSSSALRTNETNPATTAIQLMNSLWGAMTTNPKSSTGTTWEYVRALDLSPGLDLFTSHSASWAGAPTYLLSRFVGGIHLGSGEGSEGFGYKKFVVDFSAGLGMGLGSGGARGLVPGDDGDEKRYLSVHWVVTQSSNSTIGGFSKRIVKVVIDAPPSTEGKLVLDGIVRGQVKGGMGPWEVDVVL